MNMALTISRPFGVLWYSLPMHRYILNGNYFGLSAYHPAAPGSSPKQTIYAFSFIVFVLYLLFEKNEIKQKEARFGPFLKKPILDF